MDQTPTDPHVKRFAGQGKDLRGQYTKKVAPTFNLGYARDARLTPKVQPYDRRLMTGTPGFLVRGQTVLHLTKRASYPIFLNSPLLSREFACLMRVSD